MLTQLGWLRSILPLSALLSLLYSVNGAKSDIVFVNDTGASQTDFEFTVEVIRGELTIPHGNPWNNGSSTGDNPYQLTYSGGAIAPGGTFTLLGVTLSPPATGTSQSYSNFVWTPSNQMATPTPEPSTWAMLLLGFAGLGFAGYHRANRAVAA